MLEHPSIHRYSPSGSENPRGADNQQETHLLGLLRGHTRHALRGGDMVRATWRHVESSGIRNDLTLWRCATCNNTGSTRYNDLKRSPYTERVRRKRHCMLGTPRIHQYRVGRRGENLRDADNQQATSRGTSSTMFFGVRSLTGHTWRTLQGDDMVDSLWRHKVSSGTRNDLTFQGIQHLEDVIWKFTLADGSVISLADWIDDRVFGTVQLSNGQSTSLECFGAGLSQQIPGGTRTLTSADTNLQRPGSNGLPQAYEMLVFSIGIDFVRAARGPTATPTVITGIADTAGALSEPLRNNTFFQINRVTNIQFKYREKVYAEGVPVNFPNGRGAWINVTTSDFEVVNNGRPDPRSRNSMVLPIRLQENLSFKLVFNPQTALAIAQLASDGGNNLIAVDAKGELNGLNI